MRKRSPAGRAKEPTESGQALFENAVRLQESTHKLERSIRKIKDSTHALEAEIDRASNNLTTARLRRRDTA